MKPLTEAAQRNLDSGADDGAGTMVCRRCGGPKSERRINSSTCGCGDDKPERKATRHSLRVSLTTEVHDALVAEAARDNVPVATVAARVLGYWVAHTDEAGVSGNGDTPVSPEPPMPTRAEWASMVTYLTGRDAAGNDGALRRYLMTFRVDKSKPSSDEVNRAAVYAAFVSYTDQR